MWQGVEVGRLKLAWDLRDMELERGLHGVV